VFLAICCKVYLTVIIMTCSSIFWTQKRCRSR